MYLTLEVVSPQAASLGADRRRVVSTSGLTIGRVAGNDWIIPDPYISKQHARISYANGGFFVESLGRNAIAIGAPGNTLPGNQPQPLRNGDHLFIDQYEMIVTTMQGDPPGMPSAGDDPFAVLPASPRPSSPGRNAPSGSIPDVWDGGVAAEFVETGVLDPIDVLGGHRAAEPDPLPPVNWQQASALEGHFEPPPVRAGSGSPFDLLQPAADTPAVTPPPSSAGIPDNWDRTNLNRKEGASSRPSPRPVAPLPGGRSTSRDIPAPRPVVPDPVRREPRAMVPGAKSPILDPRPAAPERRPALPEARAAIPESVAAELARPRPSDREARPVTRSNSAAPTELLELLRGAGVSEHEVSPEMMQDIGKVLRVVVEGVMDVLRARAEIKSQFRLPLTRIQSAENNPLKHSPNVESALHTLLVQKNPGFVSAVQAFEDAFADIRNHQMAMLEGVRVAFQSMLQSFDPKELEKGFERAAKRGFGSAKSKYWDLYVSRFAQLGGDADDTFRRLFGDVFAEAYEKQLERLKTHARNTGKTQ